MIKNIMRSKLLIPLALILSGLFFCLTFSSCATLVGLSHNGLSPVFLHISTANLADASFYVDGQPESTKYVEYSRSQVSESAYYTTYNVISLPTLMIDPHKQYHTLTIKTKDKQWNLLLKRDYKLGFLVLDTYLTYGIGNIADVLTSNIYGFPELDLDQIMSGDYKNYIIRKQ